MSEAYIYEFLFRGQPPGSGKSAAYHVILAEEVESFGERRHVESDAMPPEKAAQQGFDLAAIGAAINVATMGEVTALKIANAALTSERDFVAVERDEARNKMAALEERITGLKAEIEVLSAPPPEATEPASPEAAA